MAGPCGAVFEWSQRILSARFLITTADEATWRTDSPVLFLGQWCQLHARREVWSKLDWQVAPYHWDDRDKLYRDYLYLKTLYERCLAATAAKLNEIHGVDRSVRYWRILIGPWLIPFVQMVFDRWEMIQGAVRQFQISGTRIADGAIGKWVPNDMADFPSLFIGDAWNQAIYSYVLEHSTHIACERMPSVPPSVTERIASSTPPSGLAALKNLAISTVARFSWIGAAPDRAVLAATSLDRRKALRLEYELGQLPRLWRQVAPPVHDVRAQSRAWQLGGCGDTDFESALRALIPLQIPTVYLEGYADLMRQVSAVRWPQRPRFIFTVGAHYSDEVFKAWAGQKVDAGTTLVIGQHGGGYGISKFIGNEDHEFQIADRYLTWGWDTDSDRRAVAAFKMKSNPLRKPSWNSQGIALLMTTAYPRFSYKLTAEPIATQWLQYFDRQCRFVDALSDAIRRQVVIRQYPMDFGWDANGRWRERLPGVRLDRGTGPLGPLVRQCRLYISSYNATTFLESLAMNIPTIMFWDPQQWELREDAKPYFDRLAAAGIFHDNPESAAARTCGIWDDIGSWWLSAQVQEARRFFCQRFSRTVHDPVQVLKEALLGATRVGT